jgi:hypothetical protein
LDGAKMKNGPKDRGQKRLGEIEDRKIQILLELGELNNNYYKNVSRLKSEYQELDKEYYQLKLLSIKNGSVIQ